MRLKTAALLVLLGLLTMLAGIGQLTFGPPSETVTASVPSDTKAAPADRDRPKVDRPP